MQRSGAITPRRAAWARSKREVWVGKRSATWRAISAPVAVMPMKTGPVPGADAGARFLAERGVRLVADHDRVGVGDLLVVADEPLVGLDRHRAVGVVAAVEQRRAQPLLVAAIGDLADELVDEVAAMGEDQDAAGARGVDEADRGDGLAGAGGVLEPEAARGAGVLRRLGDRLLVLAPSAPPSPAAPRRAPAPRPPAPPRRPSTSARRRLRRRPARRRLRRRSAAAVPAAAVHGDLLLGDQLGQRAGEGVDLVGVELGSVAQLRRLARQAAARGRAAARSRGATRSTGSPLLRPSSASAASSARRRAVPGASASGPSPSSRNGSRANAAARSMSAPEGTATDVATSLVLAITASGGFPAATCCVQTGKLRRGCRGVVSLPPANLFGPAYQRTGRTYCNHGDGTSASITRRGRGRPAPGPRRHRPRRLRLRLLRWRIRRRASRLREGPRRLAASARRPA